MAQQKSIPTLHHLQSSQSHRVLWALEELAGEHNIRYNLKKYPREGGVAPRSLKSVFPLGKSPILTLEDEHGKPDETVYQITPGVLTESRLILQFLSDTYSQGIWEPTSEHDRRRDVFFQEFANNTLAAKIGFALVFDLIPLQLPFPFRQLVRLMVTPIVNFFITDMQAPYQLMEDALSENQAWFAGGKLGLADFNVSWGMDQATAREYFDEKKFPKLAQWHRSITSRPAYKRALEKGGSYDLVRFDG